VNVSRKCRARGALQNDCSKQVFDFDYFDSYPNSFSCQLISERHAYAVGRSSEKSGRNIFPKRRNCEEKGPWEEPLARPSFFRPAFDTTARSIVWRVQKRTQSAAPLGCNEATCMGTEVQWKPYERSMLLDLWLSMGGGGHDHINLHDSNARVVSPAKEDIERLRTMEFSSVTPYS
jgi:hypothetical protein